MSEERIAEIVAALGLKEEDRALFMVDMGKAKDVFVIVEGDTWHALVRRANGFVLQRKNKFKAA